MKKTSVFKIFCVVMAALLFATTLCACGKTKTNSKDESETSSQSTPVLGLPSSGMGAGGGGAKPAVNSAFAFYEEGKPTVVWRNLAEKEGYTAKVVIKDLNGKVVFEESGIKTNTYVLKKELTDKQQYKLYVYYFNEQGKELGLMGGIYEDGLSVTYYKKNANASKYYFDGGITLDTLNNYLNRTIVYCQFFQDGEFEIAKESIKTTGAKYIQRAACMWPSGNWEIEMGDTIKKRVAEIHQMDPDIILEACIFECVTKAVEYIKIPAAAFKALGLPVENRTFDYEKMLFPDGYAKNQWGTDSSVPDITQTETQLFFYTKAMFYIDMGYEALHLGQVSFMGRNDTNYKCWTKVIKLMREYAAKNARRHYVIIDGHETKQKFIGTDGIMLADFNAFPARMNVVKGEKDHAPSESNPQKCQIYPGTGDAVYQLNIVGTSTSGWYVTQYPYLVEIDNYGINKDNLNKASATIWGYDEITWYAVQPQWYRQQFVEELTKQIDSFKENGHLSLPAKRWITAAGTTTGSTCYYAAKKDGDVNFYNDLEFYRDMWKRLGK